MSSNRWSFTRTALSAAVAIVAAAPVMAQNTTAAVSGRVTGTDGKAVAGANVSVLHRESGSVNNLVTDAEGRYSVRGLRVGGPYTITVVKGGDKDVRDGVYLALAETLALDVRLGASQLETVVLTGSSAGVGRYNAGASGAGTNLGRQELDAYASIQRNLQDYARTDPRLSQTDKERGEITALGQNTRFNAITIDGVRTNDTFGLESNNLPTAKQPISIDAIQSVQVNVSNYDVTQQGYTGANINAVTKSGTNEFKGSVYYVYRDDSLSGDRVQDRDRGTYSRPAPFTEDTKGFTLGGPIIKDKLFFFGSYEELRSTRSAPAFGPVGSAQTNVGITPAQIAAAQQAFQSKYNINAGGSEVPTGSELLVKDYLLKLDWNISDNHRANFRYSKTEQGEPIFPDITATNLSLNSHWYNQGKTVETMVGQWFADWTPNFSTELKLSKRDYDSVPQNNSNLPSVALVFTGPSPVATTGDRTLYIGTELSRHFNVLKTETTDAYFAGNLVLDDHEIKVGGDYSKNDVYNAFLQNTKGSYTFRSANPVQDFLDGKISSYSLQVPLAGKTIEDGVAVWSLKNLGLFLQDTWTVNDKLTLGLGVRVDKADIGDRPIHNPKVQTVFGYDNSRTVDGQDLVQPRFSFNYALDAKDKKKSQIRGGFGLFQGAAASVWLSNPFSNTGMATANYTCSTTTVPNCDGYGVAFSADPNNQPVFTGSVPAANVDILAPGLKQPSVWKLNLAYDAELPWYGLVAGAEWVHTKTKDGIYYQHLNLGAPTRTGPDGRQMFYNTNGLSTNCWTGGNNVVSTCGAQTKFNRDRTFNNVLLAERTSKGGGDAVTLSLAQQNRGWGWAAAYTRTNAKEVSPLTSSTSNSNFNGRAVFNPNEDVSANSAYLVKDRVNLAVNWSKAFVGSYKTTVGLFYEGRKGKPYSWTFKNDMNGDGVSGNDLMYIPTAPGSGEVLFYGATPEARAANEARFWEMVNANPDLSGSRGKVVSRNSSFAPFVNSFDLRLSQEVPGFFNKHKGVVAFDILNFGNLLNKRWGRTNEMTFLGGGGSTRSLVNFAGIQDGKYVYNTLPTSDDRYNYGTRQAKGESQWAVQITARYEF
ncbi:carboxypeptidase regulatory-like domain-containing protein [Paucibacter sp. PLA-PC-4]|uniref:TonB-dependent receptor n=1 Tax=Paucibacter sp. PLA-PC-4 TaxID=2993655 RepID=UPI0022494E5D|nr:carboxypeptidase regulatory-like domain-containing protein [Paucibacter sp. PLA-PC-4]MCX2862739.1 carboxypeptidase regulatory-like domain-containing protein [Paucibacter sp. PLA-PC-4]